MMNISENSKNKRKQIIVIIIVIAIIAVPLILFRTLTERIVDKITQTISQQYSMELNAQMSANISSTLDYYFHELNTEQNALKLVESLDEEKLTNFIAETKQQNEISYLAFADNEGFVYEAEGSYLGTMRVPMLGTLLNGTKRIVTDNVTIGSQSYIMIGMSFDEPIQMGDKSIYIVIMGLDNDELADHVKLQSTYSGGYSSIIHTDGSYVLKNSASLESGLNVYSIIEKYYQISGGELDALKTAINNGESTFLIINKEGSDDYLYLYFAPIEGTDWYMLNNLPDTFIKTSIVGLRNSIEKVYIVFVLLFVIIAAYVTIQQLISSHRLKASQIELEKALNSAEEASKAKTAFLFSMSHDIRTPMNAILGYTDIGLRHVDNTELSKDSFKKIKMAGGHLLNLINDILEMSRIESGKMALNEKPMDLRDTISNVTTMSESLADAKSIDYETIIGDIRNPYIYADELHFNEVIINIISNAVKYTPDGGKVRYKVNQIGDAANGIAKYRFEISDNGIGMSEEFQEHLFETFSREQTSTISKTEGTGLGLSIVKKIIDMAGGEIKVRSVQGQGSTFTVEIPFNVMDEEAIEAYKAETQTTDEKSVDISFEGKKVLLAEDNELNQEIACYILEDAGFTVECAADGEEALNAVKNKGIDYYDFILMDIQMPVMDGYEATKSIRNLPGGNSIPIIALSANAFEEDKKKSIDEGMNAHVAKPIDVKVLLETMQGLVKN